MKTTHTYKNLPHSFLMGVALCLFGVFFSFQAYAQHEELLDKTWYLYKLEIDGEEYEYHSLEIHAGGEARIKVVEDELDAIIQQEGCPGGVCDNYIEFIENENKFITTGRICLASDPCRGYNDYVAEYHEIDIYYGLDSSHKCNFFIKQ